MHIEVIKTSAFGRTEKLMSFSNKMEIGRRDVELTDEQVQSKAANYAEAHNAVSGGKYIVECITVAEKTKGGK